MFYKMITIGEVTYKREDCDSFIEVKIAGWNKFDLSCNYLCITWSEIPLQICFLLDGRDLLFRFSQNIKKSDLWIRE